MKCWTPSSPLKTSLDNRLVPIDSVLRPAIPVCHVSIARSGCSCHSTRFAKLRCQACREKSSAVLLQLHSSRVTLGKHFFRTLSAKASVTQSKVAMNPEVRTLLAIRFEDWSTTMILRWTVSLTLLVAMLATTAELQGQKRAPVRNLIRNIGVGWGTGHHRQTPGHNSSYYSAWSQENSISNNGQINNNGDIPTIRSQPTPARMAPIIEDNSASRILNQPPSISIQHQIIRDPHIRNPDANSLLNEQIRINQHLKPYHSGMMNPSAIQIDQGGHFQIESSQTPANNARWNSQYESQFENSRPMTPRK